MRLKALSLNYRDHLVIDGVGRWRPPGPRIPVSDGVGIVVDAGSAVMQFAKEWRAEYEGGLKNFKRLYEADNNHPVEVTGRKLRAMMPWLKAKTPPKS